MANITVLKTNSGTYMLGTIQCSNGAYWTAENCFNYCNGNGTDFLDQHQATKLIANSTKLGHDVSSTYEWWKDRKNFIDVGIGYGVDQTYKG